MEITELYQQLMEAYSPENLNRITGKLILLYKNRDYAKIRELANRVSKYVPIEEERDAKCFNRLIVLYHPDKAGALRKAIQQLYEQNNVEKLEKYAHIFTMADIESVVLSPVEEDIDYQPEYAWDATPPKGFSYDDAEENEEESDFADYEKSFYNMIKIREYGDVDMEFPPYYLEDFEEFEMASCGLESLDGVEHCIHVKILDISDNALSDLSNLWELKNLEELYAANNQIGYIDALSNLVNLKILDLSGNQIDDISPLLDLERLEYVNLIGNPVSSRQLAQLREKGIIVMTDTLPIRPRS